VNFFWNPLGSLDAVPPPQQSAKRAVTVDKRAVEALPKSFDWRKQRGIVSSIKFQGSCGACYAFSVADNVEMVRAVKGLGLVNLSPQQIIDCTPRNSVDQGCGGGARVDAFAYVVSSGGLTSASSYPFKMRTGNCRFRGGPGHISSYQCFPNDATALQQALTTIGPISAGVDAKYWQHYRRGVFTASNCGGRALNHAINIVGYGAYHGIPVWIVKNQWAASWGMGGYVYVARGPSNACGIQTNACAGIV